jgi:S1-C subfamily serine protease
LSGEKQEVRSEPQDELFEKAQEILEELRRLKQSDIDGARLAVAMLAIGMGSLGLLPQISRAEPVEIKQDQYTGAGYSFRRGTSCLVVTANHVVKEMGVPITVLDRNGAKTSGSRTWSNEAYDLALVALPDNSPVACTALWPDSAWLRRASFGPKSEFRAIRHYPGGQEVIVFLKPAGGDKDRITLAPADATSIRESDSGSIVELDGKLVGIVQSVATETQRISVLRFDRIDDLVGDRFRASAGQRVVSFAGVLQQGQPKPNWSTFVQAWISEKTGSTVISTATAANAVPKPVCDVKVDVVAWDHVAAPNPERSALALQEKACGKKGWIYEQLCKQAKETKSTAPANVASQKVSLNVTVTPTGAAPLTKLVQETHTPVSSKLTAAEIESATLRAAVGPALTDLFERGGCN